MSSDFSLPQPTAVLFACNFNRVRSPMAEGLLKQLAGNRIFVDSCGLKPPSQALGDELDPFVDVVMTEISCDLAGHRAKTFDDLVDSSFDVVVSLTPQAQHRAVEMARGKAIVIEYWPIFDPTLAEGSREARLEAYRQVRDDLAARIRSRFSL